MASSLSTVRYTTCLGCMMRRARPAWPGRLFLSADAAVLAPALRPSVQSSAVQTRGKKTGIRHDQGVVVRLLQDVPQFGRKDTILRIDRGRMRNLWYPKQLAEYLTTGRLAAMGLSPEEAVVDRDPLFGLASSGSAEKNVRPNEEPLPPSIRLQTIEPTRAVELVDSVLPPNLVFARKPISPGTSLIFGSVSADDVAAAVRDALRANPDAALVRIEARDVRFVVPPAANDTGDETAAAETAAASLPTADRVKALGLWDVEIGIRGNVPPVRRVVQVVAEE